MNPFRSERLEYRGYHPSEHDDFFARLHTEPVALASSSVSVLRPASNASIEETRKDLLENSLLFVMIYRVDADPSKSEPIGAVSLGSVPSDMVHHRHAGLAIDIISEHQGKGYGSEALKWTLDWAFLKAGLHRVELEYMEWNEQVRSLYDRVGFREEGRRRQCYFRDGRWWDEISMGILEHEWAERRNTGTTTYVDRTVKRDANN